MKFCKSVNDLSQNLIIICRLICAKIFCASLLSQLYFPLLKLHIWFALWVMTFEPIQFHSQSWYWTRNILFVPDERSRWYFCSDLLLISWSFFMPIAGNLTNSINVFPISYSFNCCRCFQRDLMTFFITETFCRNKIVSYFCIFFTKFEISFHSSYWLSPNNVNCNDYINKSYPQVLRVTNFPLVNFNKCIFRTANNF